jgi:hypothetical protein
VDYLEALGVVIARTGHERYRQLCAEDHPDHLAWRRYVIAEAQRPGQSALDQAIAVWWSDSEAMWRGEPPRKCCGQL